MGWSTEFLAELLKTETAPIFLVDSFPMEGWNPIIEGIRISSHEVGEGYIPAVVPGTIRTSGGQVHPGEWSSTLGTMQIGILPTADPRLRAPRGSLVEVRMGFHGWDLSQYQRIFLGTLHDVRRSWRPGLMTLQLREGLAALTSRWSTVVGEQALFPKIGLPSATSLDYTVGDVVLSTAGVGSWDRDAAGLYWVLVSPAAGEPFLLTATGRTATEFTGVAQVFWTTAVNVPAGTQITNLAGIEGHPVEIARRVLTTRLGDGANGIYDTLPERWGIGIAQEHIDADGFDSTRTRVDPGAPNTDDLRIVVYEPQTDVYAWLQSVLNPLGIFLTMRQGQISIRCAAPPDLPNPPPSWSVSDADLVSLDGSSSWDPRIPIEFETVRTYDAFEFNNVSERTEIVTSRPARDVLEVQLPNVTSTNNLDRIAWRAWVQEYALRGWQRLPEAIQFTVGGLYLAKMCPGDHVVLDTDFHIGRLQADPGPFRGTPLQIVAVSPQWGEARTQIRAVAFPTQPS